MDYKKIPKIDLHCHLDGSVRPETVLELALEENIKLPSYNIDKIKEMLVAPKDCKSLNEYLERFDIPNRVMQVSKNIKRIMFELYEDAALENVKYMEVRFAPLLHVNKNLSLDIIIQSAIDGMKKAEKLYDIKGNLLLAFLRTMDTNRIFEVLEVGQKYLNNGVCGVDLASSEKEGFSKEFIVYFDKAIELGYKITIHAGETGFGSNVSDSIKDLHAIRIGHGIFIKDDKKSYDLVKKNHTTLELCPTSNIQTKAVSSMGDHPINIFLEDNLNVTINTDNRTVSDTTMTNECKLVIECFDLTIEDYKKIYLNSVDSAFTTLSIKSELKKCINNM